MAKNDKVAHSFQPLMGAHGGQVADPVIEAPQCTEEIDGMERGPAEVALVVREGVLHECDQRWEDGGACRDEGPVHGLWEPALIAAEVLGKVLRRGRHRGRGGSKIVEMVHDVLLSGGRRAPRGTAVGLCPGRRMNVAELSRHRSLYTPYHTWLLVPRRAWGTVPSLEFIPLSFCYDAPLTSQYSDRRHDPWQVYGSLRCSPVPWRSWISRA